MSEPPTVCTAGVFGAPGILEHPQSAIERRVGADCVEHGAEDEGQGKNQGIRHFLAHGGLRSWVRLA